MYRKYYNSFIYAKWGFAKTINYICTMKQKITILGAGLVGSLLSIFLRKKDFEVEIFEKRSDARLRAAEAGRSINLALSHRGWQALGKIGLQSEVEKIAIPMYSRCIHAMDGKVNQQPYSLHDANKGIYSVSRNALNQLLLTKAEQDGVVINFEIKCTKIEIESNILGFRNAQNEYVKVNPEICLAADGAFSLLRSQLITQDKVDYEQKYLAHSYMEFHIAAGSNNIWQLDKTALHIWPRDSFMLIALPNLDGSFTCTLFLQNEGEISFQKIRNTENARQFFAHYFSDALALMPNFETQFLTNKVSSLATIKLWPWHKNNFCVLGDAAHAIVPFYGQGMNCGFEDCQIFDEMITPQTADLSTIFATFAANRKPNSDAIASMALDNFVEMRDLVTDAHFLALKKMEAVIIKKYPQKWLSQYEMVTFSSIPYSQALAKGQQNKQKLEQWLALHGPNYVPKEDEL